MFLTRTAKSSKNIESLCIITSQPDKLQEALKKTMDAKINILKDILKYFEVMITKAWIEVE